MTPPPITLHGVMLRHGATVAVAGLSGALPAGSMTAILGENGAGKTTLLRAIAGLHPASEGRIDRGGLAPSQIALLPQLSTLDRTFPVSCEDVVTLGLIGRAGPWRGFTPAERRAARDALAEVGMEAFADRGVGKLSAGQFQRVLFARMLAQDAPVLLLDEPFSGVDERTQAALIDLVGRLHAQGRTVVAVLHDRELAARAFPRRLTLSRAGHVWSASEAPAPARAAA